MLISLTYFTRFNKKKFHSLVRVHLLIHPPYIVLTLLILSIAIPFEKDDVVCTNLCKRQRFRSGTASSANTLLDERHGELLMRHTVSRTAHILGFPAGDVQMYTQKNVFLQSDSVNVTSLVSFLLDTPVKIEQPRVIVHRLP